MPNAAPETVVVESSDMTTALKQLSRELRNYVVRTRSVPRDFAEFAAKSRLQRSEGRRRPIPVGPLA